MWSAFFVYLEVQVVSAIAVSAGLTLHASLGSLVISRLSRFKQSSLLMFNGPGLIVGGTLAFAIFQLAGRGVFGLIASVVVCGVAMLRLLRDEPKTDVSRAELFTGLHVLGLAALVMSSEFSWLFAIAIGCFAVQLLRFKSMYTSHFAPVVGFGLLLVAALFGVVLRDMFWWVVTDDYNLFEVISKHVTRAGLIEKWGEVSFLRYHWLSYGWAGLLDMTALSPGPFVTISKVMPLVYAVALTSSLLAISTMLMPTEAQRVLVYLPVWAILANFQLDWSATSTAGVYAVLAAFLATLLASPNPDQGAGNRLIIYLLFGVTIALTKIPSLLTLPPLILGYEAVTATHRKAIGRRLLVGLTTTSIGGIVSLALLIPFSEFVGGIQLVPLKVLSLSPTGSEFVRLIIRSVVQNGWILVILLAILALVRRTKSWILSPSTAFLMGLAPLFAVGVVMNSVIEGTDKANPHEYFSKPSYFLSALPILAFSPLMTDQRNVLSLKQFLRRERGAVIISAVAGVIAIATTLLTDSETSTVQTLVSDTRIWTGVFIWLFIVMRRNHSEQRTATLATILLVTFVTVGLWRGADSSWGQSQVTPLSESEVESITGSSEVQLVGAWLRSNSSVNDIVATNHLFAPGSKEEFGDDYSLAVWSQREFLVLGPKFFDVTDTNIELINLCIRFAKTPTEADEEQLLSNGVTWFVVDKSLTEQSSWESHGETVFETHQFTVLRLNTST